MRANSFQFRSHPLKDCQDQVMMDTKARRICGDSTQRGTAQHGISAGDSELCERDRAVQQWKRLFNQAGRPRLGWLLCNCKCPEHPEVHTCL